MRNTTRTDFITGIHDLDRVLGKPVRTGLTKLRKAELVELHDQLADELEMAQAAAEYEANERYAASTETNGDGGLGNAPRSEDHPYYALAAGKSKVSQGVFEADALQAMTDEIDRSAAGAKRTAKVAYGHLVATVRSMGRLVQGKVVDTVLRTPGPRGDGRVVLVVQHAGHPTRRTLHALNDVKFSGPTS